MAQRRVQEDMQRRHEEQIQAILALFERQEKGYKTSNLPLTALLAFTSFDLSAELWTDTCHGLARM